MSTLDKPASAANKYVLKHMEQQQIKNLDKIYNHLFGYKTDGFFVELGVGGNLVDGPSNTADLADLGWRGIYVEPGPDAYKECVDRHKDNNVKMFECAAGDSYKDLTLEGDTTFPEVFDAFNKLGWYPPRGNEPGFLMPPVTVKQMPIGDILKKGNCPEVYDILSIDVEGAERTILAAYNFNAYRPQTILIETRHYDPHFVNRFPDIVTDSIECVNILNQNEYREVYADSLNSIFIDKNNDTLNGAIFG